MILFNLIFLPITPDFFANLSTDVISQVQPSYFISPEKSPQSGFYLASAIDQPPLTSTSQENIASQELVKGTLWQKASNYFFRKPIFLSISDKKIPQNIRQKQSSAIYSSEDIHNRLLSEFSKYLFERPATSSLVQSSNYFSNYFSSIRYIWNRTLFTNLSIFPNIFNCNQSKIYARQLSTSPKSIVSLDSYPLFVVCNDLDQIVLSESPDRPYLRKTLIEHLSLSFSVSEPARAWFFVNYEDAKEYMHYINDCYSLKQDILKITVCSLSAFCDFVSKSNNKIIFRLVPDLKEVSQLIKTYRHRKHIIFHEKQKYGHSSFQGQPLYILETAKYYQLPTLTQDNKTQKYNLAFTNYETALNTLTKYGSDSDNTKAPKKFRLIVYNLEAFVKNQFFSEEHKGFPFVIVPSRLSYLFTKNSQFEKSSYLGHDYFVQYISCARLWSKRIWWSLTSRQPQGW